MAEEVPEVPNQNELPQVSHAIADRTGVTTGRGVRAVVGIVVAVGRRVVMNNGFLEPRHLVKKLVVNGLADVMRSLDTQMRIDSYRQYERVTAFECTHMHHVAIIVDDLDAARDFSRDVLLLTEIERPAVPNRGSLASGGSGADPRRCRGRAGTASPTLRARGQ